MGSLQKLSILDPRIEVSETFKHWFVMLGSPEINTYVFPTTSFNQSNMTFNINLPNSTNSVIDRNSAILKVPVTITMTGGAGTGNTYQPNCEGFRARPLDKIIQTSNYNLNGATMSYQVNELSVSQSVLDENKNNQQIAPCMVDPTQDYATVYGTNRSPFAKFVDNVFEITRRAYPITVVSNDANGAVLTTDLYQNLFDWGPFSKDADVVGINIYPFSINFTFLNGVGAARMWSRDVTNHTRALSALTVTFGSPQISMNVLSLPNGHSLPEQITYPYHQCSYFPTSSSSTIATGVTTTLTSQLIELQTCPSRILIYVKPSTQTILSSLTNAVNYTDTFASINGHNFVFGNRTNLRGSDTQVDIFNMAKRNGLPDKYSWMDWSGKNGPSDGALMGSIDIINPIKDLNGDHVVGMPEKLQFQASINFTTLNPNTCVYDLGIVVIYDGVNVQTGSSSSLSTHVISSPNELQMSPMSYNQMKALVGGGVMAGNFFGDLWGKIKKIASPVIDFVRKNKLISSIASMIPASIPYVGPAAQVVGPIASSLGFGDDGGWIAGEDGDDGDDGAGILAGRRVSNLRRKRAPARRRY
jgi:hypothetical protein